jgi:hypothetical protein
MARYKVSSEFENDTPWPPFMTQSADIVDTLNGDTFREGAYRVVDLRTGKPIKGKGGTVPFFGESAWSAADRLASDLSMKVRYAR